MKRNVIRIALVFVLVLSICLATAVWATAGDDNGGRAAGVASGAGDYTWGGTGNPDDYPWNLPWHGSFVLHYQEAHHNQPAKGFCYASFVQDDEGINIWMLARVVDAYFPDDPAHDNEVWVLAEVVASNGYTFDGETLVGTLWIGGAKDGGTPGRNVDMLFSALYPYDLFKDYFPDDPVPDPYVIYEWGKGGGLGFYTPIGKGNVVVKP